MSSKNRRALSTVPSYLVSAELIADNPQQRELPGPIVVAEATPLRATTLRRTALIVAAVVVA